MIKFIQAFTVFIIFIASDFYLLKSNEFNAANFIAYMALSVSVGCIVYFREQIKRIILNFKQGSIELELAKFEEDIVNALVIKQRLNEVATGRYGYPEKLRQILEALGEEANKRASTYSGASVYTDKVIEVYRKIDSIGSLKRTDPKHDEKLKEQEEYNKELDIVLDDFLKYLHK